jgi:4-aminobutyrate aminotransferase
MPSANADFDAAAFGEQHITKGIGRLTKHVFEDGKGSFITTDKGVKLLDLTSGIGVVNLGHCHPKVTEAAAKQCGKITHAQINIGFSATQIALIQELLPILPHPSLDTVFLWNSGAEAVEAAVKLARAATKKQNIIVMQGSYHGRTAATAAMTKSKTIYGEGHGPLMPGVFTTAFPYYSYEPFTKISTYVTN